MKLKTYFLGVVLLCLHSAARSQEGTFMEPKSGRFFPTKIVLKHDEKEVVLLATGATHYQKESKKAAGEGPRYTLAHYMEAAKPESLQTIYEMILTKPVIKQMTQVYETDITAEQFQKAFARFFGQIATPAEQEQAKNAIAAFVSVHSLPLASGQQINYRWLPDNRLVVLFPNAAEKTLAASPIAGWLWKAWFNDNSPLDRARLVEKPISQ